MARHCSATTRRPRSSRSSALQALCTKPREFHWGTEYSVPQESLRSLISPWLMTAGERRRILRTMGKSELRIAIDSELLQSALDAGLDVENLTIAALRRALDAAPAADADERARRWAADNADVIQAHRERIQAHGVFGEDLRTW